MNAANIDATVAALWRVESPRVLARLARFVGDLDTAEELARNVDNVRSVDNEIDVKK